MQPRTTRYIARLVSPPRSTIAKIPILATPLRSPLVEDALAATAAGDATEEAEGRELAIASLVLDGKVDVVVEVLVFGWFFALTRVMSIFEMLFAYVGKLGMF
jgi:hypothetical protein